MVGLCCRELSSRTDRCAGLDGADRPCVSTSGVVGVVGVVPYVFAAVRSSCVSRKIGMPGKAGHCLPLREAEAWLGVEIG